MYSIVSAHTRFRQFKKLSGHKNVKHFVSIRSGGTSTGSCAGLNMGFGTTDTTENVINNRKLLAKAIDIPHEHFVFPRQTHSANVQLVNQTHRGLGVFNRESALPDTDALICNVPNTCIVVQVADCVPVLLFDPETNAIAAIHAGWRGTAGQIVMHTIEAMKKNFGSNPKNILAGIGPSIGPCCYNTGQEVKQVFMGLQHNYDCVFINRNQLLYLDLWQANKIQLLEMGLLPVNIEIAQLCTQCNAGEFYSYRQALGDTGRFVAGIMLN